MVAALRVSRHGPASRSAARRNTAARSSKANRATSGRPPWRPSPLPPRPSLVALWVTPSTCRCRCGWTTSIAVACGHPLVAADGHRQLDPLGGQLAEPPLQAVPLGAARGVVTHRLVARLGYGEDGVHQMLLSDLGNSGEIGPAGNDRRSRTSGRFPGLTGTAAAGPRPILPRPFGHPRPAGVADAGRARRHPSVAHPHPAASAGAYPEGPADHPRRTPVSAAIPARPGHPLKGR